MLFKIQPERAKSTRLEMLIEKINQQSGKDQPEVQTGPQVESDTNTRKSTKSGTISIYVDKAFDAKP